MTTQLNPQQKQAVETDRTRVLVIAGAGSGKTRVLIERIAHLVENKKVSPFEIIAFTFTRKAAGEMMERLEQRIDGAYKCKMGTMHSVALKMLYHFGELIGLKPKSLTVYSDWEAKELLKHIIEETGVKVSKSAISLALEHYYQTGEPLGDPTDPAYNLFQTFLARCRENNAMTYGMILVEFHKLIPQIAPFVNGKYLMVDEVQDIDLLQWKIIHEMLDWWNMQLFVVGDIDQSIYEFRGAEPQYLVDNQGEFKTYNLSTNYRSDAHIVNFANRLIRHNENRIMKEASANRGHRKEIKLLNNIDSTEIVRLCSDQLNQGCEKVAVLARNHFLLKKLDRLLGEANLKHVYIGKDMDLANSKEFRVFHAFLKLIVNPFDNFSFLLIKDYLGIGMKEYIQIRKLALADVGKGLTTTHFSAYKELHGAPLFFYSKPDENPIPIAMAIKEEVPDLDPDNEIMEFIEKAPTKDLANYLAWLATIDIQDEIKEDYEGIQLMTIHAAKGLEWPVVIVAGLNEGILPSTHAIKSDDVEAERRLAYVAWTRAMDRLILTTRPERSEFRGKTKHNPVSRFIKESLTDLFMAPDS